MSVKKLLVASLICIVSQAFFGLANKNSGVLEIKTLQLRQDNLATQTTCNDPSTAYHVAVTCTPVAGVVTNIICPESSTSTTTGCEVFDSTSTTTNTLTITAQCDSADCADGACDAHVTGGTASFPYATSTSGPSATTTRVLSVRSTETGFDHHAIPKPDPLDTPDDGNFTNASERLLLPRDDQYEALWLDEWSRVDPEVKHNHEYSHGPGRDHDEKFGIHSSSRIRAFGKQPFSMGVQGLVGCTSVILVSRRAVWMSHIWEIPSFTSIHPQCWAHDVIPGIFIGSEGTTSFPEFIGLNEYSTPGDFFAAYDEDDPDDENVVAAIIVTPSKPGRPTDWSATRIDTEPYTQWKWPAQVRAIRDELEAAYNIVPLVALYPVPTLSVGEQIRRLSTTGLGKVIVKYIPKHPTVLLPDGRCSEQWAGLDVWVYGNPQEPFYWDRWHAYKDQQIPLWSRDDGNGSADACPLPSDISSSDSTTSTAFSTVASSLTSQATTSASTTRPDITYCETSTSALAFSTRTDCVCNGDQTGSPMTETATWGGSNVVCYLDGGATAFTMAVIMPSRTSSTPSSTRSIATTTVPEVIPDITSCSLKSYTVTYQTTINGGATASPSAISVCACNGDRQSTPFTEIDSDGFSTVLCNQRTDGPTVTAAMIAPACPTPFAPFKPGKCTLNMTQTVDTEYWDDVSDLPLWMLSYAAFDDRGGPIESADRWKSSNYLRLVTDVILPRCDTGFPYGIAVGVNTLDSNFDKRSIANANSTNHNASTFVGPVNRHYTDWAVEIRAGDTRWASSVHGKVRSHGSKKPGYCNLGAWDKVAFSSKNQRKMDCHWDC